MNRLIVKANDLKALVSRLSAVVLPNPVIACIECIKFEIKGSILYLYASDLETSIKTSMPCEASNDFSFLFPFTDLKKLLGVVNAGALQIAYTPAEKDGGTIEVKTDLGKSKLPVLDEKDFPKMPADKHHTSINLIAEDVIKMKVATGFVHADDFRFSGVCFDITKELLYIVATDTFCLYKSAPTQIISVREEKVIIPTKGVKIVSSLMTACTVDFIGDASTSFVRFMDENIEISVRVIDQKYPEYGQIIPGYSKHITCSKKDFEQRVELALLSAKKDSKHLVFDLTGNLHISSCDLDNGMETQAEPLLLKENQLPAFKFSLNGINLLKCIHNLSDEMIIEQEGTPSKAFILRDADCEDIYVIMPLITN